MEPRNMANFRHTNKEGSKRPSLTKPDRSLTMSEILQRHTNGMEMPGVKVPIYDEDDVTTWGLDPKTLDLVDLQAMQLENDAHIMDLKEKYILERTERSKQLHEAEQAKQQRYIDAAKRQILAVDQWVERKKSEGFPEK